MNVAGLDGAAAAAAVARYDRRRAWYLRWLWIIVPLQTAIVMLWGIGPPFALSVLFHGPGWIRQPWALPMMLGDAIVAAAAMIAWTSRFSPPKSFYTDAVLAPRSDTLQRMRWRLILVFTGVLGVVLPLVILALRLLTPMLTQLPRLRPELFPASLLWLTVVAMVMAPALMALVLLVLLLGGRLSGPAAWRRAMDDELTQANRAKAMTAGFLVLLGAIIILMATMAFLPAAAIRIGLAVCAYLGLGAASLRFALLERAAQLAARDG